MIFRNNFSLQGYSQIKLDMQDRQRQLLQESNPEMFQTILT